MTNIVKMASKYKAHNLHCDKLIKNPFSDYSIEQELVTLVWFLTFENRKKKYKKNWIL